jgi:hypothetical protein
MGFLQSRNSTTQATCPVPCDGFFKIGPVNYLPRLASNLDTPDLCLLSIYDYRHEPLALGSHFYLFIFLIKLFVLFLFK